MSDPLMERLAALPLGEPDAVRAARTRARCRAQLSAHPAAADSASGGRVSHALWRPALAVVGAFYMAEALALALRVYGVI